MSALIKLLAKNYMGLSPDDYTTTADGFGLRLPADSEAIVLGGPEDGKEIDLYKDGIRAGDTVLVRPSKPLNPKKYTMLVNYNQSLFKHAAIISGPTVYSPEDAEGIYLQLTALIDINVNSTDYLFEIYLLD